MEKSKIFQAVFQHLKHAELILDDVFTFNSKNLYIKFNQLEIGHAYWPYFTSFNSVKRVPLHSR